MLRRFWLHKLPVLLFHMYRKEGCRKGPLRVVHLQSCGSLEQSMFIGFWLIRNLFYMESSFRLCIDPFQGCVGDCCLGSLMLTENLVDDWT